LAHSSRQPFSPFVTSLAKSGVKLSESIGTLAGGAYRWQRFTDEQQIASRLFPALELTVAQLVQALG